MLEPDCVESCENSGTIDIIISETERYCDCIEGYANSTDADGC